MILPVIPFDGSGSRLIPLDPGHGVENLDILPLEAQTCGTPVIAYDCGGVLETVRGDLWHLPCTGRFFFEQSVARLSATIKGFDSRGYNPERCRRQAEGFGHAQLWRQLHERPTQWFPQPASSSQRP